MSLEHSLAIRAFLAENGDSPEKTISKFIENYNKKIDRHRSDFFRLTALLKLSPMAQYQADFLAKKHAPQEERGLLRWLLLFIFYKSDEGDIRIDLEGMGKTFNTWLSYVIKNDDDTNPRLKEDIKKLKELFDALNNKKYTILEDFPLLFYSDTSDSPLFVSEKRYIYTDRNLFYEKSIKQVITERTESQLFGTLPPDEKIDTFIADLEKQNGFPYEDKQKDAIKASLRHNFILVSGGPGTGKTTVIVGIIKALIHFNDTGRDLKIDLAAPTGRAANRMLESIKNQGNDELMPDEAWTLHKLLGIHSWQMMKPRRNRDYPLHSDVVIIDESSMVDFKMAFFLLEALSPQTRMIFVGDGNQLPSIEGGAFFSDLIELAKSDAGERFARNLVVLDRSKRSNQDITRLSADIQNIYGDRKKVKLVVENLKSGEYPCIELHKLPEKRFFVEQIIKEWDVYFLLKNTTFNNKEDFYSSKVLLDSLFSAFSRFSVLAPAKMTPYGVNTLNKEIDSMLRKGTAVYSGQPIMITGNNWEIGLFNGDRGIICSIGGKLYGIFTEAGDPAFPYRGVPVSRLGHFETAYATTIHKSQGSEFDTVYIVMDDESERVVSQQLIYTAITRAKSKVVIYSSQEMLKKSLSHRIERESGLKDLFKKKVVVNSTPGAEQLSLFGE